LRFDQKPTFFSYLFIIFTFFLVLNKKNKWESGQKTSKALWHSGFGLPTFEKFLGKSPLFLGFFVRTRSAS